MKTTVLEKRRFNRIHAALPARILFEDQEFFCLIENLSPGGALLSVEESEEALLPLVKETAVLQMPYLSEPIQVLILRLYSRWSKKVLAVQIESQPQWKKFWFDLTRQPCPEV